VTSRLKTVKGPPLLNPPPLSSDINLFKVRPEDTVDMLAELDSCRNDSFAREKYALGMMHTYLKNLGMPQHVTDADADLMRSILVRTRTRGVQHIAMTLFHAREMGMQEQPNDSDREEILHNLEHYKTLDYLQSVKIIFYAKKLGIRTRELNADEKGRIDYLFSSGFNGQINGADDLAEMHFMLPEIGYPQIITPEHIRVFEEDVKRLREQHSGFGIARLLGYLNKIMPKETETEIPPMPPIKRFGGGR
jgi:hypothetical protein